MINRLIDNNRIATIFLDLKKWLNDIIKIIFKIYKRDNPN